jgi:hypothetical protein
MGKKITDLVALSGPLNDNDKFIIERDGKSYSLKLSDLLSIVTIDKIDGGIINYEETPSTNSIGEITAENNIIINEELLSAGTYTLRYIDSNDNIISNFKPITDFTI